MSFELSPDQRIFVDLYSLQYTQITEQTNRMQEQIHRNTTIQNELRNNIQTIYSDATRAITTRHNNSNNHHSNPNLYSSYFSATLPSTSAVDLIATETTSYLFSDIQTPINTECPIRLEPFGPADEVVQINRCGHIFNREELRFWFRTNTRCPMCRREVSTRQTNSNQALTNLVDLFFSVDASNNSIFGRYI